MLQLSNKVVKASAWIPEDPAKIRYNLPLAVTDATTSMRSVRKTKAVLMIKSRRSGLD